MAIALNELNGELFTAEARARFKEKYVVNPGTGCWMWQAYKNAKGYGTFAVTRTKRLYAHRASWALHRGRLPAGALALHRCDNPSCVNPEHLFVGTWGDNTLDMLRKGRAGLVTTGGENSPLSKLTEVEVAAIRAGRASGVKLHDLAAHYGVTKGNVSRICAFKSWRGNWTADTPTPTGGDDSQQQLGDGEDTQEGAGGEDTLDGASGDDQDTPEKALARGEAVGG